MRMRSSVPALLALCLGVATLAEADPRLNARLRGDFAFEGTRQCVNSSTPFAGTSGYELPAGATAGLSSVIVDTGTIHYNGDGTGNTITRNTSLATSFSPLPSTFFPLSVSETTCTLHYSVDRDGMVTEESDCTGIQTIGHPDRVGGTTPVSFTAKRWIGTGGAVLIRESPAHPVVETTTFTPPGSPPSPTTTYRICVRASTATKIPRR